MIIIIFRTLLAIIAKYGLLIILSYVLLGGVYEQNIIVKKCPCK